MCAMRRKEARKAMVSAVDSAESAVVGGASEQEVLPEVSWEELLARAEAALDDKGLEAKERREAAAAKKLRRMRERGVEPKWDVGGIRRALAAYYADCVLGECRRGFRKVFASAGVVCADFFDARDAYPELRMVFEYIQAKRSEMAQTEAEELSRQAQAAQKRLVTEEGCELNQRAVELSLKATMKGVYGDGDAGGERDAKKSVTYLFPNMRATWIVAPSEAAKRIEAKPEPEVIDV